jgi:hypothetical protein
MSVDGLMQTSVIWSLAGVTLGVILTSLLTRRREIDQWRRTSRLDAYAELSERLNDYARALREIASVFSTDKANSVPEESFAYIDSRDSALTIANRRAGLLAGRYMTDAVNACLIMKQQGSNAFLSRDAEGLAKTARFAEVVNQEIFTAARVELETASARERRHHFTRSGRRRLEAMDDMYGEPKPDPDNG